MIQFIESTPRSTLDKTAKGKYYVAERAGTFKRELVFHAENGTKWLVTDSGIEPIVDSTTWVVSGQVKDLTITVKMA